MKQTSAKRHAPPSPPRGPRRQRGAWRCAFGRSADRSGRRLHIEHAFEATPYGTPNPADLTAWRQTTTVNGRESVLAFDKAALTFTATSPAGRQSITQVDQHRRPLAVRVPGLAALDYRYDARGRLSAIRQQ